MWYNKTVCFYHQVFWSFCVFKSRQKNSSWCSSLQCNKIWYILLWIFVNMNFTPVCMPTLSGSSLLLNHLCIIVFCLTMGRKAWEMLHWAIIFLCKLQSVLTYVKTVTTTMWSCSLWDCSHTSPFPREWKIPLSSKLMYF